jgi:DNA repair protein RecN (Recombination protein N)
VLRHLRATNFAILSDVAIELGPGLNALTGETGAGKSLIVEAVNLLRGGRASADIPREGAAEAVVEAIFELEDGLAAHLARHLEDAGLPDGGGELLVRRVIHRGGRSRTYVNGALTTAGRLAEIGGLLVDLSSQHQHQGLADPRHHLEVLDAFAGAGAEREAMAAAWEAVREAEREIAELTEGSDIEARLDYLRYQLEELDAAGLRAGEEQELAAEKARLAGAERLGRAAAAAALLLYDGDGSAADRIGAAEAELERIAAIDPDLASHSASLAEARAIVEDIAATLRGSAGNIEDDPERLAAIDDRLALIRRLARKHGAGEGAVAEVAARAEGLRAELASLENREARLLELESVLETARARAEAEATALSRRRRAAAGELSAAVGRALAELGMAAAVLEVAITAAPLSARGADRVELLLGANRGEIAKPLARIASGGELSRIMLALKLVLRGADEVSCYVFDEVDTGLGGATAEAVGAQIKAVAATRQVLCVTHLAPIAALADVHFSVSKSESSGRTETHVDRLVGAARTDEIARMLGGAKITRRAREHAREMLRRAG